MSDSTPPIVLQIDHLSVGSLIQNQLEDHVIESMQSSSGQWLYQDVNLSAHQGEIILILGASGSGKSLLMNLLIGKVKPFSENLYIPQGQITLCGHPLISAHYPDALLGEIGVLYQGLGLLEDLSARQNLQFAYDHSTHHHPKESAQKQLEQLASTLEIQEHLDRAVSDLSGGQRQRVGIARLLAYQSRVMIFDEPTSALDPHASQKVVKMIADAHQRAQSDLTLIVTHDYEHFFSIADQVWQIQSGKITASNPKQASFDHRIFQHMLSQPKQINQIEMSEQDRLTHVAQQKDQALLSLLKSFPQSLQRALQLITHPKKLYWSLRYGLNLFKEVVLKGLIFHITTGFIIGLIATYFAFNSKMGTVLLDRLPELNPEQTHLTYDQIKVSHFIIPTFFKEMLAGFSVAMYRALIPLFTCVFIAARGGTATTAYLSTMRDPSRSEWEALKSFGVNPHLFFLVQLSITFSLGCIVLSLISFISASFGSLLTSLWTNELCDLKLWWGAYTKGLGIGHQHWIPKGTWPMIIKTGISGLCIAMMSQWYGTRPRRRAQEVMSNLTKSNVWSVILTLIVFFIILINENT